MNASLAFFHSEYVYAPLTSATSVRYVKLRPGVGRIRCEIFEARTDAAVAYTALSYAWGSDANPRTIRCSGTHYLTVGSNLYQALWHIRHPSETRTLWIDAICINQSDIAERNHQVAQMTKIYTQAERLIIWLGGEGNRTAVDVVKRISQYCNNATMWSVRPRLNIQDWKAMGAYLGAGWFQRVWV
jgi:hypothetical protein